MAPWHRLWALSPWLCGCERPSLGSLGPSSFISVAEHALHIVRQPDEDRDEALDLLYDRDMAEDDDGGPVDSEDSSSDSFHDPEPWLEDTRALFYCGADGVLNLTTAEIQERHAEKKIIFVRCHKVVGQLELTLHQPWEFHNDGQPLQLELQGRLVISAEEEFTCLTVEGELRISGFASFTNCRAGFEEKTRGGAIESEALTVLEGGQLELWNCSSHDGGAIFTWHFQSFGLVSTHHCHSTNAGGSIHAQNSDIFSGEFLVENSSCGWKGGAISSTNFTQFGGRVLIHQSAAQMGGALWAKSIRLVNGTLSVQNATAFEGGAIFAETILQQSGGLLDLRDCTASGEHNSEGGCLRSTTFELSGGAAMFQRCKATDEQGASSRGGAVATGSFIQEGGSAVFENSSAFGREDGHGGAMYVEELFVQSGGQLRFQNCHAQTWGGAIAFGALILFPEAPARQLEASFLQFNGTASFTSCHAGKEGGAIHSKVKVVLMGQNSFQNCSCSVGAGGALRLLAGLKAQRLAFRDCHSRRPGAGLAAARDVWLGEVTMEECDSGMLQVVLYTEGNLTAQQLTIRGAETLGEAPDQHVAVGGRASVASLRCSGARGCDVSTVEQDPELRDVFCPCGHGLHQGLRSVGCQPCSAGTMAIFDGQNATCQPCPASAELCLPSRLKMPPGQTVDPSNLSLALHCPNPQACVGGELSQHSVGLLNTSNHVELEEAVSKRMCREGYMETACWKCASGYGMTDASPLLCTKCSLSPLATARSISFYVAQDAWPFMMAVAGALSTRRQQSTVLLNQLMAFGMISQHIVNILMQSQAFQALHSDVRRFLRTASHILAFTQAEGSGDFETSVTRQCLLEALGLDNSLPYLHLVSTFVPCILILLVSLKHPWLSLMVGANVFLPAIGGAFGKYFLGFDNHPVDEHQLSITQVARPFLPESMSWRLFICVMLLVCFVGTTFWWSRSIRSVENEKAPAHVLYLTLAYKDEWRWWEIERFLRKMTISLVAASLSVSCWDSTRLFLMSLILLSSLLSILICRPYIHDGWNVTEALLLAAALMMVSMLSLLASHWAVDLASGKLLAALVMLLAVSICGVMMVLVMMNAYSEWQSSGQGESEEIDALRDC